MHTWFNSPDRLAALQREQQRWLGTPFFPNSCDPGPRGGVSCQKLVSAIYRGVGYCDVIVPEAPMNLARFARALRLPGGEGRSEGSLIEPFMLTRPEFARLDGNNCSHLAPQLLPGDLLGFRIGQIIHHLAIYLPSAICHLPSAGGPFLHVLWAGKVAINYLSDPTWSTRLAAAWRPTDLITDH